MGFGILFNMAHLMLYELILVNDPLVPIFIIKKVWSRLRERILRISF